MELQPGYDVLANAYEEAFPDGFTSAVERHAMAIFATDLLAAGKPGPVLDIGCGTGHVTRDLSGRGLDMLGIDPSREMLNIARLSYPGLPWMLGDASLSQLPDEFPALAGISARFSLIHVEPESLPDIFAGWVRRLRPGAHVLVAFQCSEDTAVPVREFDHTVARAWRWHPDAMAATLEKAGLSERWRLVNQPDDQRRFAECHLIFELRS